MAKKFIFTKYIQDKDDIEARLSCFDRFIKCHKGSSHGLDSLECAIHVFNAGFIRGLAYGLEKAKSNKVIDKVKQSKKKYYKVWTVEGHALYAECPLDLCMCNDSLHVAGFGCL